jgi:hypothetical protein
MLDDLRNQASFDPGKEPPPEITPVKRSRQMGERRSFDQMTGMTAAQRFILAVMLFAIVCLLGFAGLVVTGKIVPPFMP